MSSHLNEIARWLGHFHPALVHLPVGGLVVLGVLELLALGSRCKDAAQNRRVILAFVAPAALAAAACGWLSAAAGGYDAEILDRHRLLGIGVAGGCIVTLWLSGLKGLRAYRAALLATLVLLVLAGHFGGEMTHGGGFLTRLGPAPQPRVAPAAPGTADGASVYAALIQPVLQRRCVACHGPAKQKGKLRLDSYARVRQGGQAGAAIVPGQADESLIIQRLLLPPEDEDHMPPDGKPQPTPAELALLRWWINAGAPETDPPTTPKDAK
jgi:uncharacterized membrane protein